MIAQKILGWWNVTFTAAVSLEVSSSRLRTARTYHTCCCLRRETSIMFFVRLHRDVFCPNFVCTRLTEALKRRQHHLPPASKYQTHNAHLQTLGTFGLISWAFRPIFQFQLCFVAISWESKRFFLNVEMLIFYILVSVKPSTALVLLVFELSLLKCCTCLFLTYYI